MTTIFPFSSNTTVQQGRAPMTTAITSESIINIQADAVVIGISGDALSGAAAELNDATAGGLQSLIDSKKAKTCAGKVTSWLQPQGIQAPVVLIVRHNLLCWRRIAVLLSEK